MEHQFNQSDSGCLADLLQERMNHDELKYKVFDWLRFPLIVFVVYIHSSGKPIDFYAIDFSNPMPIDYYNLLRISISHVLTHIAVPMFFFISGFLFFNKLQKWNRTVYFDKLKKRIKTLLIPFVIWNTIKIMLKVQSMIRHDGFKALFPREIDEDFYTKPPKDDEEREERMKNPRKLRTRLMFSDLLDE